MQSNGAFVICSKIVDYDKKPTMTIKYEAIDRAKESIKDKLSHSYNIYITRGSQLIMS